MKRLMIILILIIVTVTTVQGIEYTDDLCTGGSASTSHGGVTNANYAFNNQDASNHAYSWKVDNLAQEGGVAWVQYQMPSAKKIEKLRLNSYSHHGFESIKDFTLQASNTGVFSGEEVSLVTGQQPEVSTGWVEYPFSNEIEYTYYRVVTTSHWYGNGGNDRILHEIEMMEAVIHEIPVYSEFSNDFDTTNFSAIDVTAVDDPILANNNAKVEWKGVLDLDGADLDSAVQFNSNFVSVDSAAMAALNVRANITMKGFNYDSVDEYYILKDGVACGDCIKHSANPAKFEVSGFSNYTTGGNLTAVPEFSTMTFGIGLLAVLMGIFLIRRK